MKLQSKKGIQLNQAFGAVLALVLVAVLVIVAVYLFSQLGQSMCTSWNATTSTCNTAGQTAAYNATQTTIVQFGTYPALVGLVGTIIFLGIVIGVLVSSFVFGGRNSA